MNVDDLAAQHRRQAAARRADLAKIRDLPASALGALRSLVRALLAASPNADAERASLTLHLDGLRFDDLKASDVLDDRDDVARRLAALSPEMRRAVRVLAAALLSDRPEADPSQSTLTVIGDIREGAKSLVGRPLDEVALDRLLDEDQS